MRVLSTVLAASAALTFSLAPAMACEWGKMASKKLPQTTAQLPVAEDEGTSIATNDLSDETVKELTLLPLPGDKPAE